MSKPVLWEKQKYFRMFSAEIFYPTCRTLMIGKWANIVDRKTWSDPFHVCSDLGLHYMRRPLCLNTWGEFGIQELLYIKSCHAE